MIDTLLFDLDNTLLDFDKAEANALSKALHDVNIKVDDLMLIRYNKINSSQWKLLEKGIITREEIKLRRFKILFEEFSLNADPKEVENLTTLWNNLPNYLGESGEQALVIADTSGSMSGTPIEVALSIALYYAERNKGPWQNHFMTFSTRPKMQCIRGSNLLEKFQNMASAAWDGSTNVEAAFQLILDIAKQNKLTQDELPESLIIISDMEFNSCCRGTNYQNAQRMFEDAGYKLPQVVFWNVSSRNDNLPVRFDEAGTALVSGYSASIIKTFLGTAKRNLNPVSIMMETLNSERYKNII